MVGDGHRRHGAELLAPESLQRIDKGAILRFQLQMALDENTQGRRHGPACIGRQQSVERPARFDCAMEGRCHCRQTPLSIDLGFILAVVPTYERGGNSDHSRRRQPISRPRSTPVYRISPQQPAFGLLPATAVWPKPSSTTRKTSGAAVLSGSDML